MIAEKAKLDLAERGVKTAGANYFPELSVGYFNQSLDHVRGFQGIQVGVSIPIFSNAASKNVKRSKIGVAIQHNNLEIERNALESQLDNLLSRLELLTALYQEYDNHWTQQIELLENASELELKTGAVDFYRYVQARSKVLEIRLEQLNLINQLNNSYYALEYFKF